MARLVFLLLVFFNLAFFVWAGGYLGRRDDGREPERLAAQLQPERLRVSIPVAAPGAARAAAALEPVPACRSIGPLPLAAAETLRTSLASQPGLQVVLAPVEQVSYWVSIPPLANKAAADKKAGELQLLGIKDYFVVGDAGPERYAISLGLYHSEELARDRLQQLARQGVKSAHIEAKPRPADRARLEVRAPAEVLGRQLAALPTAEGLELAECPVP